MSFLPDKPPAWVTGAAIATRQPSALSLEQALGSVSCLVLSRTTGVNQLIDALGGIPSVRRYEILAGPGEILGTVEEESAPLSLVARWLLPRNRRFRLHVVSDGRRVMSLERPRFWLRPSLHLTDGADVPLGSILPHGGITADARKFDIVDPAGQAIGAVTWSDAHTFDVRLGTDDTASTPVTIRKSLSVGPVGMLPTAYNLALMLPGNGDVALGRLGLAIAIMADAWYLDDLSREPIAQAPLMQEMLDDVTAWSRKGSDASSDLFGPKDAS